MPFRTIFSFTLLILLLIPGLWLPAEAAQAKSKAKPKIPTYTLKEAVEYALQANPGVEAKLLAMERAQMAVGVAQSYFWPTVSLTYSRNKLENTGGVGTREDNSNKSRSRGVRVSWSVFSGFAHLNNLQKSLLSVDVEEARHRQAKLELITNVQLQFLNLLKAREDMKTVQASRKRITTQLQAARAFVDEGMAPHLNVLQNEVEMSKVEQQEIRVANSIRNAEVVLNKYLGYDTNTRVNYVGILAEFGGAVMYTEEEAINTSLYSRPDLIMAQKSVAVALKQSHITAAGYLPKVNLTYDNMDYRRKYRDEALSSEDYNRSYWNIGLNVTWDVFDGGGTTFTLLGDRKNVAALRKEYEDTMNAARAEVIRALLDIDAARELITVSRKGMEAAQESYDMANQRYLTHIGTITDLLDAQLRLTEAEEDYNQALTEFNSARARFYYHIGRENTALK